MLACVLTGRHGRYAKDRKRESSGAVTSHPIYGNAGIAPALWNASDECEQNMAVAYSIFIGPRHAGDWCN